jgi:hypothetical protein
MNPPTLPPNWHQLNNGEMIAVLVLGLFIAGVIFAYGFRCGKLDERYPKQAKEKARLKGDYSEEG